MWLPPFKYIKGLFSQNEISGIAKSDGTSYVGPYFKTSTGELFSGEYPNPDSELLIDSFSDKNQEEQLGIEGIHYSTDLDTGISAQPIFPTPEDYKKGFFIRYFLMDNRNKKIVEVKEDEFGKQTEKLNIIGVEVKWIIDKPVKDIFNSGYLFKGAATRNRENILNASLKMPPIKEFIVNYAQFADIESDVEGVPFRDLSRKDKLRLIHETQPINVSPPTVNIKPRFGKLNLKKQKVFTHLYTSGNRFKIAGSKKFYTGFYHIHPEKGAMVGPVHTDEPHSRLIPVFGGFDTTNIEQDVPTSNMVETPDPSPTPTTGGGYSGASSPAGGSSGGGGGYSGGGGGGSSY